MMLKRVAWSIACLLVVGSSVVAQSTIYTSSASFLPNVQGGFYTESFTGGSGVFANPVNFSANGFSYTVTATGGTTPVYRNGTFIGNTFENQPLTFTMTSGNVTAIGANFFLTDINDNPVAASMTITLSDGTIANYVTSLAGTDYRGFVSPGPIITSVVLSAPGTSNFNSVDNFTVGAAVPEPTTLALIGLSLAGAGGYWYRTRKLQATRLARNIRK